jgi:hypothetical protein
MGEKLAGHVSEQGFFVISQDRKKPPFPGSFEEEQEQFPHIGAPVDDISGSDEPVLIPVKRNRAHQTLEEGDLPMEISHDISCHQADMKPGSPGRKKA